MRQIKKTSQFKIIFTTLLIALLSLLFAYTYTDIAIQKLAELPTIKKPTKEYNNIQEWVLNEIEKAGIDKYKAYMIIWRESRWNTQATNINKGGKLGIDRGLWQISDKFHPEVSNSCAYDYKCATKEAIRIIKKRGFSEWYAAKYYGFN